MVSGFIKWVTFELTLKNEPDSEREMGMSKVCSQSREESTVPFRGATVIAPSHRTARAQ